MAIYLERDNQETYSNEELKRLREHLKESGRFFEDTASPNCYFRGQDRRTYAIQLIPGRIQINQQLLQDKDPIIRQIIDDINPSYYLQDGASAVHSVEQLKILLI